MDVEFVSVDSDFVAKTPFEIEMIGLYEEFDGAVKSSFAFDNRNNTYLFTIKSISKDRFKDVCQIVANKFIQGRLSTVDTLCIRPTTILLQTPKTL